VSAAGLAATAGRRRWELPLCGLVAAGLHAAVLAWAPLPVWSEPQVGAQLGDISIAVDLSAPLPSAPGLALPAEAIEVREPDPLERPSPAPPTLPEEQPSDIEPAARERLPVETSPTPPEALETRRRPPAPKDPPPSPGPAAGRSGVRAAKVARCSVTYPELARRRGWQGAAVFEVRILASGRAGEVRLVTGSGYRALDRAALRGLRAGKFRPRMENGKPVAARITVKVRFVLRDGRASTSAD
jgi:protein TonB